MRVCVGRVQAFGEPIEGIARSGAGVVGPSGEDAPAQELEVPEHLFSPKSHQFDNAEVVAQESATSSLDFLDAFLDTQSAPPVHTTTAESAVTRPPSATPMEWTNPIDKATRSSLWFTDDRDEAMALEKALENSDLTDGAFVVHPNPDPTVGPSIGLAYR